MEGRRLQGYYGLDLPFYLLFLLSLAEVFETVSLPKMQRKSHCYLCLAKRQFKRGWKKEAFWYTI
jgi:hypothetical protein